MFYMSLGRFESVVMWSHLAEGADKMTSLPSLYQSFLLGVTSRRLHCVVDCVSFTNKHPRW